jgi:hypothetical protein
MSNFNWNDPTVQLVIERVTRVNRKVTPQDCEQSKTLRSVAEYFASNYSGDFEPMQKIAAAIGKYGQLKYANQFASAINCMMHEWHARNPETARLRQAANFVFPEATLPTRNCIWCAVELPAGSGVETDQGWVCADRNGCRERQRANTSVASQDGPQASITAGQIAYTPLDPSGALKHAQSITPACPNGTFTVVLNEQGEYRTLRLVDCPEHFGKPVGTQIAQYLSGADNESDYTGFAFVSGSTIGLWSKFRANVQLGKALATLIQSDREKQIDMGEAYAIESGRCFMCGRKLTVPASLHRGTGPICAEKLGIA